MRFCLSLSNQDFIEATFLLMLFIRSAAVADIPCDHENVLNLDKYEKHG